MVDHDNNTEDMDFLRINVELAKDLVCQELDGEMVILDLHSGEYYGVDLIGTRIWRMLEEHVPPVAIVDELLAEYEVDLDTCHQHLASFFRQLEQNKLIKITPESVSP